MGFFRLTWIKLVYKWREDEGIEYIDTKTYKIDTLSVYKY